MGFSRMMRLTFGDDDESANDDKDKPTKSSKGTKSATKSVTSVTVLKRQLTRAQNRIGELEAALERAQLTIKKLRAGAGAKPGVRKKVMRKVRRTG